MVGDDEGAPPASRGADRWRSYAPAALLALVATVGVVRSVTLDQSSWQGVSFGMFATYENESSRVVHVTVHRPGGPVRVGLPPDLAHDAVRLRVVPTEGAARRLAAGVLDRAGDTGARKVVVEVWRLRLSRDDGHLRATRRQLTRAEAVR